MTANTEQGTVMIVDDAPGNLALLSDALREAGYRILVATDGITALDQLQYVIPDVILLDGVMPGMDGFETCRQLKLRPETRQIPILFMTALGDLDDLLRGFNEGAVDYIVKPFRNEEVLARVAAQLNQVRATRRAEQALTQGGLAAMAIDDQGAITWITPAASAWLAEMADAVSDTPVLPSDIKAWVLAGMLGAGETFAESYTKSGDGGRYSVQVSPCEGAGEYLLMVGKRTADWDIESARSVLGLTFKETEVLMWISRGKTNRDIGMILNCSPRTVNKHLEHIFEKLGVETRTAAAAVVMQKLGEGR